jgi:probable HAF family extracellular repeat protein
MLILGKASGGGSFTPTVLGPFQSGIQGTATGVSHDGSIIAIQDQSGIPYMQQGGVVTALTMPDGVSACQLEAVSSDGSTIVGYGSPIDDASKALSWSTTTQAPTIYDILSGYADGVGAGCSSDGSVLVGYSYMVPQSGSGWSQACRWTSPSGVTGLGYLNTDYANYYSQATGCSSDGSVVVGFASGDSSGNNHAFLWTSGGGMTDLGVPAGGSSSQAYGCSADGSVVVGVADVGSDTVGFVWTEGTGMVSIGLPPSGGTSSWLYQCSSDGTIGAGIAADASGNNFAFKWTHSAGIVPLPYLPGAATLYAEAVAISGNGLVFVGDGEDSGNNDVPIKWS